jgi:uncharacterized membrane protein YqjE
MNNGPDSLADAGTVDRVRSLMVTSLSYVGARGKLLQIEAQEAGAASTAVLVRLLIGLGMIVAAWLLLMPCAVYYAAQTLQCPWPWVAASLGAAHFLIGIICLVVARNRWSQVALFEETLNQFEKDRQWVGQQPKN